MTLCMDAKCGRGMAAAARGVLHMVGPWYIGAGVRKPPLVTTPSSSSEGGHRTLATHVGLSRMATDSPAQPTRSTDPSAHHRSADPMGNTSNPPAQPGVQAVDDLHLDPIEASVNRRKLLTTERRVDKSNPGPPEFDHIMTFSSRHSTSCRTPTRPSKKPNNHLRESKTPMSQTPMTQWTSSTQTSR